MTGGRLGQTGTDFWVVNLDGTGAIRWQRLLGGGGNDVGTSAQQTADRGYILAGYTVEQERQRYGDGSRQVPDVWLVKLNATALPVSLVPGGIGIPTDTNADGLYDDVNGNGRRDFADVVLYFNQMTWIAANEPIAAFDYNGERPDRLRRRRLALQPPLRNP